MNAGAIIEASIAYAALAVPSFALFVAAWHALGQGRIYAVLFGALATYGLITLSLVPPLVEEFSADRVYAATHVYFVGAVLLMGSVTFWESWVLPRRSESRTRWVDRIEADASTHARWATLAGVLSMALFLASRDDLSLSWSETRAEDGFAVVVATFLLLLSFPGIVSAVLSGRRAQAIALLGLNLICFVFSGSRAAALGALAFFGWIMLARSKSRWARLRILIALGVIALLVHVSLRFIRGFGMAELVDVLKEGNLLELFRSSPAEQDISGGESAIAEYFVFAIDSAASSTYGFMTSVVRLALILVPSSWAPFEKPMDVTYQLWASAFSAGLFDGAQGSALLQESFLTGVFGSVHATLFGELFVAGRWPSLVLSSILVGALCVFVDRCLDRLSNLCALLVLGPVIVGMLMVGRGNSVIGFGYFVYLTTFVVSAEWLCRFLRRGLLFRSWASRTRRVEIR